MARYNKEEVKTVLSLAGEEVLRLGGDKMHPEHLFLGILRAPNALVRSTLFEMNVDIDLVKQLVESKVKTTHPRITEEDILLTKATEHILNVVEEEIDMERQEDICAEHILLAILRNKHNYITMLLNEYNVNYNCFKEQLDKDSIVDRFNFDDDEEDEESGGGYDSSMAEKTDTKKNSQTPALDAFSRDITAMAERNELDPIVGREREISRLSQVLSRRKKNNPILIGEPGVGKSAIVEGLAKRIVEKKVSRVLFNKRIVALDIASVVAGTKYRGQFEERMKAIINELAKHKEIILFIDEIHTIVGAGGTTGSLDAANMLKPALSRGEIQCIGATTLDEFRQNIEKDGALDRRFQKILVEQPSLEETLTILSNIKTRYEEHHKVNYTDEAIMACAKMAKRYISDRSMPDKAIDALDEAGASAHISNIKIPQVVEELEKSIEEVRTKKKEAVSLQNFELAAAYRDRERFFLSELEREQHLWENQLDSNPVAVDEEQIAEVIATMTGVPVKRIAKQEGQRLMQMETELSKQVIGQNQAIEKIVKAIRRNRAGLRDPNRPIGSFMFLGPTGVGKTQLAKSIATILFDNKDALIRIDMSEYMEKFAVSRLMGAPPGYVGYEEGGQLTERVRRKPYSVVLLDEIEKAHPDVFNILLQILDDGQLTDSVGRTVDFKNTIIIMTSNIGSRQVKDFGRGIGFNLMSEKEENAHVKGVISKALRRSFSPEFLNRLDEVIVFNSLNEEIVREIVNIELDKVIKRITEIGYHVDINENVKDYIVKQGFEPEYGARPLKRAIQKYLEDEVAEAIIKEGSTKGIKFNVYYSSDADKIMVDVEQ
ncbi:MAG: ATP-dependent Clp protease ATP-binding subunit [Marinifilaceae bacterium]